MDSGTQEATAYGVAESDMTEHSTCVHAHTHTHTHRASACLF